MDQFTSDIKSVSDESSADAQRGNLEFSTAHSDLVVPIIREQLSVQKALRTTGTVRIQKVVHENAEIVAEDLATETVEVERVPVDRIVETAPSARMEGDTTIIPVIKEEIVVVKRLRVVEELRITKRRSLSEHRETVVVRGEEVLVDRDDSPQFSSQLENSQIKKG